MYKNLRLVYITTKDREEARSIGRKLVEEQLAACVNILDGMESIYMWDGEIHEENECVLLVKTHYSRIKKMTRRVKELHSYDCPCVITFTITEDEGNTDYLNWLEKTAKQPFEI
ncbi:divalent-cation tolerance protein CutA [Balneola sp. MJW-20]|uniref:divalent-cation tolerance protein CutA n=1 Tax=Gracilimonas aurantiaca TaxID=3234185 RepID=UPI00346553D6